MTESKIELRCPKCSISIMVSADQAGEKVDCPRCQNKLLVPGIKNTSSKNTSFDDLIDIDDEEASSNTLAGDAIEAVSFGGRKPKAADEAADEAADKVVGKVEEAIEKAKSKVPVDLPSDLQLAPVTDSSPVVDESEDQPIDPDDSVESDPADPANSDDDLGDLLDFPETNAPIPKAVSEEDPFQRNENANLVVDGVTPADGQFPVDCHLCGSLLYARVSQIGTQIKCHDCHSLIDVHEPRVEPTPIEPNEIASDDKDAAYQLSDPVELEPIDRTIDTTLGDIDFNDDDNFEKRNELQRDQTQDASEENEGVELEVVEDEAEADETKARDNDEMELFDDVKVVQKEMASSYDDEDDGNEYEIAPFVPPEKEKSASNSIVHDISSSQMDDLIAGEQQRTPDQNEDANSKNQVLESAKHSEPQSAEGDDFFKEKPAAKGLTRKERLEAQQSKPLDHFEDTKGLFEGLGDWFGRAAAPFKSPAFLIRMVFAGMLIGCGYFVFSFGLGILEESDKTASKFFGFIAIFFGLVPLALGAIGFGTSANPVIQGGIHRDKSLGEFPEFSMGTWMGEVLYIGTSFWAASIPGVIFGAIIAAANEDPFWIFYFAIVSALMLVPFFLASVMQNQSPWMLLSDKVFRAAAALKFRWIRFVCTALLIGLLIASGLLLIRFGALGFVVGLLQLALLGFYYWILGDLIGYTLRRIENDTSD